MVHSNWADFTFFIICVLCQGKQSQKYFFKCFLGTQNTNKTEASHSAKSLKIIIRKPLNVFGLDQYRQEGGDEQFNSFKTFPT